jgi:hypothetical protein
MKRTVGIPVHTVAWISPLAIGNGTAGTKAIKIRDNCDPALWHWGPAGRGALPAGRAPT